MGMHTGHMGSHLQSLLKVMLTILGAFVSDKILNVECGPPDLSFCEVRLFDVIPESAHP